MNKQAKKIKIKKVTKKIYKNFLDLFEVFLIRLDLVVEE